MATFMKLKVERADGTTQTYPVLPVTIVAYERHFSQGMGQFGVDMRMEHLYWLAWDAEKRTGAVVKPFDGWLEEIANVEAEDESRPLAEGASPAS